MKASRMPAIPGPERTSELVRAELRGCPYSLPDDTRITEYINEISEREKLLRDGVVNAHRKLEARGVGLSVERDQRAREIYESNAIEGVGLGMKRTAEVLVSPLATRAAEALAQGMLVTSITREQKLVDILGHNNAKLLATNMLADAKNGRPMTEADIRDIHRQITDGQAHAGRYKRYVNQISGSSHTPPTPIDTPAAMSELVKWMHSCRRMPTTLMAAVAHAWLAHIHPFEDGNGRVCRILVNMMMVKDGLPPVIIDHKSYRARYIESISISDSGGDILPLTETIALAQTRFVREINRPRYLRQIVNERIAVNASSRFLRWNRSFNEFMEALATQLAQYQLHLDRIGDFDSSTFGRLMKDDISDRQWVAVVKSKRNGLGTRAYDPEILIALARPTARIYDNIEGRTRYPSLRFAIRFPDDPGDPFRGLWRRGAFSGIREVAVIPDTRTHVYIRSEGSHSRVQGGYTDNAAEMVARAIAGESNEQFGQRWDYEKHW